MDRDGKAIIGENVECRPLDVSQMGEPGAKFRITPRNGGLAELDASGVARMVLPEGAYRIGILHLLGRAGLSAGLVASPGACTLDANTSVVPLVCERARRLCITLQVAEAHMPGAWCVRVQGDPEFRRFGGDRAELWIGEAAQKIEITTQHGAVLAIVDVPAGRDVHRAAVALQPR